VFKWIVKRICGANSTISPYLRTSCVAMVMSSRIRRARIKNTVEKPKECLSKSVLARRSGIR
jgi:hypothetical protein